MSDCPFDGACHLLSKEEAVRALAAINRIHNCRMTILAMVRSADKAQKIYGSLLERGDVALVIGDVRDPIVYDGAVDYIIHGASVTASKEMVTRPVETIATAIGGTEQILKFAVAKQVTSMVYISSMEMYGTPDPALPCVTESDYGRVDVLQVRSCYPEGKRMAEQYCCAYAAEYGVPAMVVRLAQTFGPGIPKSDGRLFAMCARNVLAGEDIVLKTTGASTRMYLYTADAVSALLTVMLKGEPGCAYNAANPSTYCSVREMAEMVATLVTAGNVQVRCEIDPDAPYPPEHHLPLDVSRLEALGWAPTQDLPGMYRNLMAYLED